MSGQKRPADSSGASSSGAPPEKRREREGEDGGPGVSAAAGGSTAVETVIKLGGVSNSVSLSSLSSHMYQPSSQKCQVCLIKSFISSFGYT